MAIFDLSGKISLDSAPFMRGLKDSESSMKEDFKRLSECKECGWSHFYRRACKRRH